MDERKEVALHGFRRLKEEILDEGSKKRWIKYKKGNSKGQVALLTVKHIKSNPDKYEPISSKSPEVRAKLRGKSASPTEKPKAKAPKKVAPKKKAAPKKAARPVAGRSKAKAKGNYTKKVGGQFKPDKFIAASGATPGLFPDRDKFDMDDPYTRTVVAEFDAGKGLFYHVDAKGKRILTNKHSGQAHYMQKYVEGFKKTLSDKGNFANKEQHKALQAFVTEYEQITADFAKTRTPKGRLALAIRQEQAFEKMNQMLDNEKDWETGPLKDFSEFVEHNTELLLGQENYMPSAGNFKIGDKVMFYRDKAGGVRCTHGSYKSESKLPKDAILKKGGAAPANTGEVYAVTFFKDRKKDQTMKDELNALYSEDSMTLKEFESKHEKILVHYFGKKKGPKLYAEMVKNRDRVMTENEQQFNVKMKELRATRDRIKKTEKNKKLRDHAINEIKRIEHKMDKHISMYAGIVPLFSQITAANFTTQVSIYERANKKGPGRMHKSEVEGCEGYEAHSKHSRIGKSMGKMSAKEIIELAGKKISAGGWYDIQNPNCIPILNGEIVGLDEYCSQKQQKINEMLKG